MARRKFLVDSVTLDNLVDGLSIASRNPEVTPSEFSALLCVQRRMTRPRDILNRLKDLGLLSEGMRLTALGEATESLLGQYPRLAPDVAHCVHYLRHLGEGSREYFMTYKLVADHVYRSESLDTEQIAADVLAQLLDLFGLDPGSFGFDKSSVTKALYYLQAMNGAQATKRTAVRLDALIYALRVFYTFSGMTPGQLLLLDDSNCALIGRALFLDAAYVRAQVQQAAAASSRLYLSKTPFGQGVSIS